MLNQAQSEATGGIRPIQAGEEWFLKEMLYEAIFTPPDKNPLPESIVDLPELSMYITGFGRAGDVCWVAERDGALAGAIWSRLFSKEQPGYGFVDEQTPEFSMAVKPAYRGQGIGTLLLNTMVATLAQQGYRQLSLSVDTRNRALNLYKKLGFEVVSGAASNQVMVRVLAV